MYYEFSWLYIKNLHWLFSGHLLKHNLTTVELRYVIWLFDFEQLDSGMGQTVTHLYVELCKDTGP